MVSPHAQVVGTSKCTALLLTRCAVLRPVQSSHLAQSLRLAQSELQWQRASSGMIERT